MIRVASLYLPQLAIQRLRRHERPHAPPEPAVRVELPVDDDPGDCSVPRGGGSRPGTRWARDARPDKAEIIAQAAALPRHQQPPMRELGRRSEAAEHPFRRNPVERVAPSPGIAVPTQPAWPPLVLAEPVGKRQLVAAACPSAAALGLTTGIAVTHARALVPGLDVRPADPIADTALLDRLAFHAARQWTSTAARSDRDGLWLDLTGVAHLHGGEERFCRRNIDRQHGCMVVVRPDQYVADVLPVDAHADLAAFLSCIFADPRERSCRGGQAKKSCW